MKKGRGLTELASELESLQNRKLDFISDTKSMEVNLGERQMPPEILVDNVGSFVMTPHATRQVCSRLNVPAKFYSMMLEGTDRERAALQEVMNSRLQENTDSRMVRAISAKSRFEHETFHYGTARAFLSDRYRRIDNYDMMMSVLDELSARSDMRMASCEITQTRMYLKFTFDNLIGEPVVGDAVRGGIVISNSEIGAGSLKVERLVERLICLNGMIRNESMKKYHVGTTTDAGIISVLSDEAMSADDKALQLKFRDVIRAALSEDVFQREIQLLRDATQDKISSVPAAVKMLSNHFSFSEDEQNGVLQAAIESDALISKHGLQSTRYGLAQAVTAFSQRISDYERATEFEYIGGQIIDMPKSSWSQIAKAT